MISPLPWRASGNAILDKYNHSVALTDKEDAEYIVKCCNLFPKLVEALEELTDFYSECHMGDKYYDLLEKAKEDNNTNE